MTSDVATAEVRKLAHTLGVDPADLDMVASLSADDLRTLRRQVGEALFQADRHHFVRVAALSKAVPVPVVAKITEVTLPPLLAARTAELLEPSRAAEMVGRLSNRYLADVSAAMDASRAPEVVAAIPTDKVAAVGAELARREEWIVIGGFVSHVSPDALAGSLKEYTGAQLLRIAFVLDDRERVDQIGRLLSDPQVDDMLMAAARDGLWTELAGLVAELSDTSRDRFAARYAQADAKVRAAYDVAAAAGELDAGTVARLSAT